MPDGGAEALLLFLSERRIDAPLAIMSGDSQEERLYHLAARGAEAFFSKPIPVEQMIEWVASLTQTRT
jgi:DNA-binding NarL/FixJ family response regulator